MNLGMRIDMAKHCKQLSGFLFYSFVVVRVVHHAAFICGHFHLTT